MIVKIITLFLVFMAILALFGRLRFPKPRLPGPRAGKVKRCPKCGRPLIGPGPCDCERKG